MMEVLGITGGIGSGKSVISRLLEIKGIPVYYSDSEAKKITVSSSVIREKLTKRFGASLYKNETLDKKLLASLIFNNSTNLSLVNSIIHPEVYRDFLNWKNFFRKKNLVGLESAILFESKFNTATNFTLSVTAPEKIRIERTMNRDKLTKEEVLARIKSQISEEERNNQVDFIIKNDNICAVIPQVEKILSKLNFQEFV